ncbi:MAG: hypothetical protein V1854_05920 [Methanobacteriota archaeon]
MTTEYKKSDEITYSNNEGTPLMSREQVLQLLGECIIQIHNKIKTGRIRNTTKDKARQDMQKVQGYLTGIYLQGLKDLEIEELALRISKLEAERK